MSRETVVKCDKCGAVIAPLNVPGETFPFIKEAGSATMSVKVDLPTGVYLVADVCKPCLKSILNAQ